MTQQKNRALAPRENGGKSAAHLVKWSCVVETALPNLVHRLFRSCLVRTGRIGTDGKNSPPSDAGLEVAPLNYTHRHHTLKPVLAKSGAHSPDAASKKIRSPFAIHAYICNHR